MKSDWLISRRRFKLDRVDVQRRHRGVTELSMIGLDAREGEG